MRRPAAPVIVALYLFVVGVGMYDVAGLFIPVALSAFYYFRAKDTPAPKPF